MIPHADLIISEHEPLAPRTWFGLGGPARWFVRPRGVDGLGAALRSCRQEERPAHILGFGANLLIGDDGVDGVVLSLDQPCFRRIDWGSDRPRAGDDVTITVGAGTDMSRLARDAVRRGLAGLECMGGIPGTLGGIIRMNAGGRFGQIADVVRDVTVVDENGDVRRLSKDEVGFTYRRTRLNGAVVCAATLVLRRDDPAALRKRFLEIWQYKKLSQPLADMSAGCVFKNPPGDSAGRLIEQAGLKGRSVGGACVSPRHANFIVAKEGATARDVLNLIGMIRREVAQRSGIELELEIEVWGNRRARRPESVPEA